jgi:prolyl-tRNA editing enzyme YbaK/EbsC (Cys-tRNA(Pro) deacylase)
MWRLQPATTRADVNGVARGRLEARKASFVDAAVIERPDVVVGSGVRRSKLVVPGSALAEIGRAEVLEGLAR